MARIDVSHLVVSISGLSDDSPQSLHRAADFTAELDARGVPASQLFRPRGASGPTPPDAPLVRFLHERRDSGDAIVLHGYDHSHDPAEVGLLTRVGRRAEFAALPRHEAGLRLTAARRALTVVGLRTDVFVPPRWLASPGTVEALCVQGFRVLADENGVQLLDGEATDVVCSKVLGFRVSGEKRALADDRRAAESWRCRVLVAEVARTARSGGLVRINVRAKDLKRPPRHDAVLTAIDAALELGAVPGTYRLALTPRAA